MGTMVPELERHNRLDGMDFAGHESYMRARC